MRYARELTPPLPGVRRLSAFPPALLLLVVLSSVSRCEALTRNDSLLELDLAVNLIDSEEAGGLLYGALANNHTVLNVRLEGNALAAQHLKASARARATEERAAAADARNPENIPPYNPSPHALVSLSDSR